VQVFYRGRMWITNYGSGLWRDWLRQASGVVYASRMKPPAKRREAFSQARQNRPARFPTEVFGAAGPAERLRAAIDAPSSSSGEGDDALAEYTHRFHSYPARLHPATARRAALILADELPRGAHVLDPFCGSGTVLVEGVRAGFAMSGLDASPLALLLSRAKTWRGSVAARRALVAQACAIRDAVLAEGKAARRAGFVAEEPVMRGAAARRRQEALAGWFDPHVRREVEALRAAVGDDELLRAILSSVLVKVSRRASDSKAEVAPRRIGRGMAARLFADRAAELAGGVEALWRDAPRGTPAPELRAGDARALPAPAGAFAAVLTSPPYAGTYDYADHHGLRLAFLGLDPAALEKSEIGSRRSFRGDAAAARAAWDADLGRVLAELARVVAPGGPILLVLGDSLAGAGAAARAVHADDTVARLAPAAGLEVVAAASAPRAPLGQPEVRAFAERPKREHLIWLRSASGRPRPPRRSPSS
jgi:SAM-dependent methyltransferase